MANTDTATHTQGPWTALELANHDGYRIRNSAGKRLGAADTLPDARLIARAPTMDETLTTIADALETALRIDQHSLDWHGLARQLLDEIAAARGTDAP